MVYEISKEAFKQRLENKLNFAFIDLIGAEKAEQTKLEGSVNVPYGDHCVQKIQEQYPAKTQNILLYTFEQGDRSPAKAAEELGKLGYHFVYFYCGTSNDFLLDKGLN